MAHSSWLVGSRPWTGQTIAVDGQATNVEAPLGGLYLVAAQGDLSLLHRLALAMFEAGVVAQVELLRNRRVRIMAGGVFSTHWGTGVFVRELLGFSEDLEGASSYVAPRVSELLWSPGKTETPKRAPLGALGGYEFQLSAQQGFGGYQVIRQHGPPIVRNVFEWRFVRAGRYWASASSAPGEYAHFFSTTLIEGHRFMLWRKVDEADSSSSAAGLLTSLGPYALDLKSKRARRLVVDRARGFGSVEAYYDVELDALVQPEFGQI